MEFCTAINCMDGRVQLPVIGFLRERLGARYVDVVTEPGPSRILALHDDVRLVGSILRRVDISVERHGSGAIAVVAHHDCAGNPVGDEEQIDHLQEAVRLVSSRYPELEVIGLWVDDEWHVEEMRRRSVVAPEDTMEW